MRVLLDMAMTPSLSGLAVSGLLAFTTLTRSLQLISPNLVASLRSLELVLAFLVQAVITGQPPQTLSWLGGGLILIGNNSSCKMKCWREFENHVQHRIVCDEALTHCICKVC